MLNVCHRMQRNFPKLGGNISTSIIAVKPPKPPCWLDLKAQRSSSDEGGSKHSPVGPPITANRSGKTSKRPRPKLHRTRSQYCIENKDLPDCELPVSLAETKPEDIGLRKQVYDEKIIMEESTRKCQSWLQSIEACGPPDNVSCGLSPTDVEGVDVEVPDDTLWYDEPELRPPHNSSASSSDCEQNVSLSGISPHIMSNPERHPYCEPQRTVIKSSSQKYQLRSSDRQLLTPNVIMK